MINKTRNLTLLVAALVMGLSWGLFSAVPAQAAGQSILAAGAVTPSAIELPGEEHHRGYGGHNGRRGGCGGWY